jgi:hypothetical protein
MEYGKFTKPFFFLDTMRNALGHRGEPQATVIRKKTA